MPKSKSALKKLHREFWQWLADNPNMHKWDWPKWKENGGQYDGWNNAHCFACEYSKNPECSDCPCDWGGEDMFCEDRGTIFDSWQRSKLGSKERTKYALLIKDAWK